MTTAPIAVIDGEPFTDLPNNLYIPPDAMAVVLQQFEGPLDLLLYLIRKHRIDILNIPMVTITEQYLKYIDMMKSMQLTLAGEYLLMAATLCDIKARLLLPKPALSQSEGDEEDPRAELIRRLQAYQQIKQAADALDELPRLERDRWPVPSQLNGLMVEPPLPSVTLRQLLAAYISVLKQAKQLAHHTIQQEVLSVRERMVAVLTQVKHHVCLSFQGLLRRTEGRFGVVVTLLALLELTKQGMIALAQTDAFAAIEVKGISS